MHFDPTQITLLAWIAGTVTGFAGGLAVGYVWRNSERRAKPIDIGRR